MTGIFPLCQHRKLQQGSATTCARSSRTWGKKPWPVGVFDGKSFGEETSSHFVHFFVPASQIRSWELHGYFITWYFALLTSIKIDSLAWLSHFHLQLQKLWQLCVAGCLLASKPEPILIPTLVEEFDPANFPSSTWCIMWKECCGCFFHVCFDVGAELGRQFLNLRSERCWSQLRGFSR